MRRQIMSADYQKLKLTNLYKELQSIYPSDISVIIAGYDLEKTEHFRYMEFEGESFDFSKIGTKVFVSDSESTHIHEIDDFKNFKRIVACHDLHMFGHSLWVSMDEYLCVACRDPNKLLMLDKSMRIVSEHHTEYIDCFAAHNNNLYVASHEKIEILDKNLVLLNTIRGFESLEKICVYDDKIYAVDHGKLKICDHDRISDVIMKNVSAIAIFDEIIYVCRFDKIGCYCPEIYDMKFNYIRDFNYDFNYGQFMDMAVSDDHVIVNMEDDGYYYLYVFDRKY